MTLMTYLLLIAGLVLLVVGADLLVKGASRIAAGFGISPLVIGLTIVAFGTSAPEAAISIGSALKGEPDIAVGNVVGSNIFNVLFILGVSALISPLLVSKQLVRVDVPVMVAVSLCVFAFAIDGRISSLEGAVLFVGILTYLAILFRIGGAGGDADECAQPSKHWAVDIALVVVGLAMLVLGARWLVASAVTIAADMGVSELVIGLTIVAAGTSLPEVATSIIATIRGQRDIAVGNVVGSNIFNILAVLRLTAIVAPGGLPVSQAAINFDFPVMLAVAIACLPIFFVGYSIARWEGGLFLGYYLAYTTYLILAATAHDALPEFSNAMLYFVLPLTMTTLLVVLFREYSAHHRPRAG